MTHRQRVAVVTGAAAGLGKVAASALARAGFTVIGTSRNAAGAATVDGVTFLDLDVSSDQSVATLIERVIDKFGRIDVLVNNAGIGISGAAEEVSLTQTHRVFDTNVYGVMRMTKAVLPVMRAQRSGRIINISSIFGFLPAPFMAAYAATKHAVEGYSESVDHEVRQYGVRVLLVEPAGTRTGFDDNTVGPDTPLAVYAEQRQTAAAVIADAVNKGDHPTTVGAAIVAAATDQRPRLRYTGSPNARRLSTLRRLVPARAFDGQLRKFNKLAG
jgi:short-subunit dehydrogenase